MKEHDFTTKHVTLNLFAGVYPFTLAAILTAMAFGYTASSSG